jgi:hypothetical protein
MLREVLLHAVKIYDMEPSRFTSHQKEGVLRIFIAIKTITSAGFQPSTLGSSGQHTNHYTTEATI